MKDLALAGGDLVPGGRGYATVDGSAYIRQRIALALGEPYGDDPYHPTWGSALPSYLGKNVTDSTPALVSSEVSRVLAQLIDAQRAQITAYALTGARSQLSSADVIASVDSVDATASWDTINVSITMTTQAGAQLAITRTLAPAGA